MATSTLDKVMATLTEAGTVLPPEIQELIKKRCDAFDKRNEEQTKLNAEFVKGMEEDVQIQEQRRKAASEEFLKKLKGG